MSNKLAIGYCRNIGGVAATSAIRSDDKYLVVAMESSDKAGKLATAMVLETVTRPIPWDKTKEAGSLYYASEVAPECPKELIAQAIKWEDIPELLLDSKALFDDGVVNVTSEIELPDMKSAILSIEQSCSPQPITVALGLALGNLERPRTHSFCFTSVPYH